MLNWVKGDKLLAVVHFIYFWRILQKLSKILHPSRQNWTTEVCFFCKRKLIHENIRATYFSPLTLSWSVSMKIIGDSLYYSSIGSPEKIRNYSCLWPLLYAILSVGLLVLLIFPERMKKWLKTSYPLFESLLNPKISSV